MSLNALGVNQLALKASSSAIAPIHDFSSGQYAGMSPAGYDVIVGTGTTANTGQLVIPLSILDIPSGAVAGACFVQGFQRGVAASNAVKVVGVVNFVGGPAASANLTLEVQSAVGALVAAVQTISYIVYIPRNV